MQAALYQNVGNINVTGVVFDTNVATGSGGGLYQNAFAGSVQDCTFRENRVGGSGGGLFQNNYRGNVEGCVFERNSAKLGGAMYQNAATGMTDNSTFTGNGAMEGGAIYQVSCIQLVLVQMSWACCNVACYLAFLVRCLGVKMVCWQSADICRHLPQLSCHSACCFGM